MALALAVVAGPIAIATSATTGSETIILVGVSVKQKAMIYRNCVTSSVRRKADVIFDVDGTCTTIGVGKAIVIHQVYVLPTRTVYRSSKSC